MTRLKIFTSFGFMFIAINSVNAINLLASTAQLPEQNKFKVKELFLDSSLNTNNVNKANANIKLSSEIIFNDSNKVAVGNVKSDTGGRQAANNILPSDAIL